MASSIKRRRNSTKWLARWNEYPGGPEKSKQFDRKSDGEKFLAQVMADLQRGTYVDPNAGRVTFIVWAEQWRGIQVHREGTSRGVESQLRNHVYPVIGDRPLDSIRRSDIQSLVKHLERRLAPSTTETVYRYVAAIFRAAVGDRIIAATPCVEINLPKIQKAKVTPLDVADVESIADVIGDRYRALVILAAGTGLRQGECFGLTVDRVDFLRKRITVDRQIDPNGGEGFAPLKTEASARTIPLPEVVSQSLAAHLMQWPVGANGLIFSDPTGRRLQRNRFSEMMGRARQEAGAPEWMTFHDLRHFYASLLIRHGESVKVVQARLGHASASETLDTYAHMWPDSEDQTRAAVDSVLGSIADQSRTKSVV
jgi:integrase